MKTAQNVFLFWILFKEKYLQNDFLEFTLKKLVFRPRPLTTLPGWPIDSLKTVTKGWPISDIHGDSWSPLSYWSTQPSVSSQSHELSLLAREGNLFRDNGVSYTDRSQDYSLGSECLTTAPSPDGHFVGQERVIEWFFGCCDCCWLGAPPGGV